MKPYLFGVSVLFGCLLHGISLGDSFDDAEAKKRNVPVQQIQLERAQQRIAELEQKIAELENPSSPQPASQPATAPSALPSSPKLNGFDQLEKWYATLPSNLMPSDGELQIKMQGRFDWFKKNVKLLPVQHISGTLIAAKQETYTTIVPEHKQEVTRQVAVPGSIMTKSVTETKLVPESRQTETGVGVDLQTKDITIWGKQFPVFVHVFMKNVTATEASKWTTGKVLECSGQMFAILDPYEAVAKDNRGNINVGTDFSMLGVGDVPGVSYVSTRPNEGFRPRAEVKIVIMGNVTRN
jgi:hypothetical protein